MEEESQVPQKPQLYQFPLPRKNKELWEKQQAILKEMSTQKQKLTSFSQFVEWLDKLRDTQIKSETRYKNLQTVFETFNDEEKSYFLKDFFPQLCENVLKIKKQALPNTIPKTSKTYEASFTREEISQYVSCMFLCILKDAEKKTYKDFRYIFIKHESYENLNTRRQEKIKCIYDYLKQSFNFSEKEKKEVVNFSRVNCGEVESYEDWMKELNSIKLKALEVTEEKLIEDYPNTLQVDFANADIGGGILGDGLVQEEIRFSICPEMLVSLLLFDTPMKENEVILMKGIKQYCDYTGYSNTFRHIKMTNTKSQKIKRNNPEIIVAIDALFFTTSSNQFSEKNVTRELNKAYFGFKQEEQLKAVATGKWGCGAFNGVFDLKFVIQWIASSRSNKKIILCTFQDGTTCQQIQEVYNLYKQSKASQLLKLVIDYPDSIYMEDYTLIEYLIQLKTQA